MNNYIALFRGINVGGKNILPMKELKHAMITMGLENVQSYIQSGNLVFSTDSENTDQLSQKLSDLVMKRFGFQPAVMLFNEAEFQHKVSLCPFDINEGKIVHLFFLADTPTSPDSETLNNMKKDNEAWSIKEDMFFLRAPDGIGKSKLAEKAEKSLRVAATARNGNTALKLLGMLG